MKDSLLWDLSDIATNETFPQLIADTKKRIDKIVTWRKHLSPQMEKKQFVKMLNEIEDLKSVIACIYDYPALKELTDRTDIKAREMKATALDIVIAAEESVRFIDHWLQGKDVVGLEKLNDEQAEVLFSIVPEHKHLLWRSRELALHTLSDVEERIILQKDLQLSEPLLDLRRIIESEQQYKIKLDGEKKTKVIRTQAELSKLTTDANPKNRESAYRVLFKEYEKNLDKYFIIYQAIAKDWFSVANLRGYNEPISMRNRANDLPDELIDLLYSVCSENLGIFHNFFELKANLLKIPKLRRFDLYAPLKDSDKTKYSFAEALDLVIDTFEGFDKDFADKAKRVVAEGHIDSHPSPKKAPGAFCATINPKITPYVFLNFTGKTRDVFTLAHELGHAVHSLYSSVNPYSGQNPTLPLAETASTFAELLLFDRMMQLVDTETQQKLLMERLADSYATIMRQINFSMFEKEAFALFAKGTNPEDVSSRYYQNLLAHFGDSVDVDQIFSYEWAYIPHFVNSPFYVYAYAFGELLALSLFAMYKDSGEVAVNKLKKILTFGRTAYPIEMLKELDISLQDRDFWMHGFSVINNWQKNVQNIFSHERI